jgi:hypothetical protein
MFGLLKVVIFQRQAFKTISRLGCRSPPPPPRRLLEEDEIVVEPVSESHREAARSLGATAPVETAGGYHALATVMTGSLRRPRRDVPEGVKMTTFGK